MYFLTKVTELSVLFDEILMDLMDLGVLLMDFVFLSVLFDGFLVGIECTF